MENTLIILSVLDMTTTTILALYAVHVMRKYKQAAYREGYYKGLIDGEMLGVTEDEDEEEFGGMRKDCIHCAACARHEDDFYECPENCFQYEKRERP